MKSHAIVHGLPMEIPQKLVAALVIRLGGHVELTPTEIEAAEGLLFAQGKNGIVVEACTDPSFSVLDEEVITDTSQA